MGVGGVPPLHGATGLLEEQHGRGEGTLAKWSIKMSMALSLISRKKWAFKVVLTPSGVVGVHELCSSV